MALSSWGWNLQSLGSRGHLVWLLRRRQLLYYFQKQTFIKIVMFMSCICICWWNWFAANWRQRGSVLTTKLGRTVLELRRLGRLVSCCCARIAANWIETLAVAVTKVMGPSGAGQLTFSWRTGGSLKGGYPRSLKARVSLDRAEMVEPRPIFFGWGVKVKVSEYLRSPRFITDKSTWWLFSLWTKSEHWCSYVGVSFSREFICT